MSITLLFIILLELFFRKISWNIQKNCFKVMILASVRESLEELKGRLETWKEVLQGKGLIGNIKRIKMMIRSENSGNLFSLFPFICCLATPHPTLSNCRGSWKLISTAQLPRILNQQLHKSYRTLYHTELYYLLGYRS